MKVDSVMTRRKEGGKEGGREGGGEKKQKIKECSLDDKCGVTSF